MSPITYFFASVALLLAFSGSASAEIKATAILFRHGERTPQDAFPNLPCKLCDDLGLGQLTKVTNSLSFGAVIYLIPFDSLPGWQQRDVREWCDVASQVPTSASLGRLLSLKQHADCEQCSRAHHHESPILYGWLPATSTPPIESANLLAAVPLRH